MNNAEFSEVVQKRLRACETLLVAKGDAYAGRGDRLANFKRNAERLGLTVYQVWAVYFFKHIDAIANALKDNPSAPVDKSEGTTGRIADAINYLLLLEAMLAEHEAINPTK